MLVVEDEMLVLLMIEDALDDLGCDHTAAATTLQALDLLETRNFDAATLDMNLNGDRRSLVADSLAAHGVPFVFATGYGGLGIRDRDRHRPVLRKPFHEEDLIGVLGGLVTDPPVAGGAPRVDGVRA